MAIDSEDGSTIANEAPLDASSSSLVEKCGLGLWMCRYDSFLEYISPFFLTSIIVPVDKTRLFFAYVPRSISSYLMMTLIP